MVAMSETASCQYFSIMLANLSSVWCCFWLYSFMLFRHQEEFTRGISCEGIQAGAAPHDGPNQFVHQGPSIQCG